MTDELTDAAKAEIAAAIAIVREDKNDQWWRSKVESWEPKKEPSPDPVSPSPTPPTPPSPTPPPPNPEPTPAPEQKRRGLWWGDSNE